MLAVLQATIDIMWGIARMSGWQTTKEGRMRVLQPLPPGFLDAMLARLRVLLPTVLPERLRMVWSPGHRILLVFHPASHFCDTAYLHAACAALPALPAAAAVAACFWCKANSRAVLSTCSAVSVTGQVTALSLSLPRR